MKNCSTAFVFFSTSEQESWRAATSKIEGLPNLGVQSQGGLGVVGASYTYGRADFYAQDASLLDSGRVTLTVSATASGPVERLEP